MTLKLRHYINKKKEQSTFTLQIIAPPAAAVYLCTSQPACMHMWINSRCNLNYEQSQICTGLEQDRDTKAVIVSKALNLGSWVRKWSVSTSITLLAGEPEQIWAGLFLQEALQLLNKLSESYVKVKLQHQMSVIIIVHCPQNALAVKSNNWVRFNQVSFLPLQKAPWLGKRKRRCASVEPDWGVRPWASKQKTRTPSTRRPTETSGRLFDHIR